MTKTIAITGGIGSGKSTFCSKLKEKGFKIHSSDEQVAKIYKNPEKKFVTYLRTIGLSKSISKKNIDKKIISKIIFENKQIRKKLELYIFKIVRKKRSDFIKQEKQKKTKLIFIDIPLLFENNLEKQFNKVISIIASKRVRLKRLKKTRKMTENQFKNITRSQTSDVIRKKKSDYVIYNNSTLKDYKIKINKLISKL
jgi:dephospho-CoA kinase|tara:strand:+ start:495 stop:1085 length:591 start_codon:yes stop_codon:yes gene_type:complete